jgi:two-component system chemotaxis response regulator CheY
MQNKKGNVDWKSLHVLIVDDQKIARDVLRDMLHELGVNTILEAKDGTEALALTEGPGTQVHLLICDWNMPGMTGLELLQKVRGAAGTQPFLMVTGRNDLESIMDAKKFGVTAYILKPFSLADLEDKITRMLAKK